MLIGREALGDTHDPLRTAALRALGSMTTIMVRPGIDSVARSEDSRQAQSINRLLSTMTFMVFNYAYQAVPWTGPVGPLGF